MVTDLLKNTLDGVELVATDNDLLALVQRQQGFELGLDARAMSGAVVSVTRCKAKESLTFHARHEQHPLRQPD